MPSPQPVSAAEGLARVVLGSPPVGVDAEVAATPEAHAQGLMFRRGLDPYEGMLFVFEAPALRSFWMRNTLVPLDLLFLDAQGWVVGLIEGAEPLSERPLAVDAPSRFVLELAAGFCRRHAVTPGSRVHLPEIVSKELS